MTAHPSRDRWRLGCLIASCVLVYGVVWLWLGTPYRFFPSDDRKAWELIAKVSTPASFLPQYLTTNFAVYGLAAVLRPVTGLTPSLLIVIAVLCNALTMGGLAVWAYRLTQQVWASGLVLVLFATCAWPTTYLFFWFYAPVAAVYVVATAFALFESFRPGRYRWVWLASGLIGLGVCFFSCVSAAVIVGLLGLTTLLVHGWPLVRKTVKLVRAKPRNLGVALGGILVAGWLVAVPTGLLNRALDYAAVYRQHLAENVKGGHYNNFLNKFGYEPKLPALTGVWVISRYSWALLGGYLGATVLAAYLLINARKSKTTEIGKKPAGRNRGAVSVAAPANRLTALETNLVLLAGLTWAHEIIVDALPTTKLARTHYMVFPLICLLLALAAFWLWNRRRDKSGRALQFGLAGLVVVASAEGVYRTAKSWETRYALPRFLERRLPEVNELIFIGQDPHSQFLAAWLSSWKTTVVDGNTFNPHEAGVGGTKAMIVGPTGPGSGNSVFLEGCLPDLVPFSASAYAAHFGGEIKGFPCAAYNPLFCLEEENCQALLWKRKIPDPAADPQKLVSVLWWPSTSPPAGGSPLPAAGPSEKKP